ncbi:PREDICTED: probable E3 ubiquitin-protein ligase XERICO [Populus euphratica]|uniref:Probable E3 ubiquitin-protein ligase XERICO n=1 Tax=Populus euphratica TaxID=75702 RepID=A0AAJ6TR73_POPEU|nr:PREDICTED: probable E3 ubiquitin-protein ligase XERICO [Populus euphratica]
MLIKYLNLIIAHLRWAFNFLCYYPFSFQEHELFAVTAIGEELNTVINEAPAECAVCLDDVEEGEEIRELRCGHIFHRACLYRWLDFRQSTCPLCRGSLAFRRTLILDQRRTEVLTFKFCSFKSTDERDTWWLR